MFNLKTLMKKGLLVLSTISLLVSCTQLKNDKKEKYIYNFENSLNKNQILAINNLIESFDSVLIKKYSTTITKPEKRILEFVNKLIYYYKVHDYNSIRKYCEFILPHIKSIKDNGLVREIWIPKNSNYKPLIKVKKWSDSIKKVNNQSFLISELEDVSNIDLNKNALNIIDTINNIKVDNIDKHHFMYELNNNGLLYYSIYKASSSSDKKIKEHVLNRINNENIAPILSLIAIRNSFEEKEMNNDLFKIIILFEFILPNYL